jgi:hypothetical protein
MVVFVAAAFSLSSDPLDLDLPFSGGCGPDDCLSRREVVSGRSNTPDSMTLDDSGICRVVIEAGSVVDAVVGGTLDCPSDRSRRLDVDASKLAFLSFNCSIFFLRINEL